MNLTDFHVVIMKSNRQVKAKLGHVVQLHVCRLPFAESLSQSSLRQTANMCLYCVNHVLPLFVLFTVLYNYTKSVDSRQFTAIHKKCFELFLFAHFLI